MLADTSAWVEYLRASGSPTHVALRGELLHGSVATTEPVIMEVLAGARSEAHLEEMRSLMARAQLLPCRSDDYGEAAFLYRLCRANGATVRSLVDCLIAAVAIRSDMAVLHRDRDFDALARHTPLDAQAG